MSIVRVGLAETHNYAEGWDTIFSKAKKGKKPASATLSKKKKAKRPRKK